MLHCSALRSTDYGSLPLVMETIDRDEGTPFHTRAYRVYLQVGESLVQAEFGLTMVDLIMPGVDSFMSRRIYNMVREMTSTHLTGSFTWDQVWYPVPEDTEVKGISWVLQTLTRPLAEYL